MKYIPPFPDKCIKLIKEGKLTKGEVLKNFEKQAESFSSCKDGSAEITQENLEELIKLIKEEGL